MSSTPPVTTISSPSTQAPPAVHHKPLPFMNRWDIYPVLGTAIAPLRLIFGLFQGAIGLIILAFEGSDELFERSKVQIKRSFISLVSFLPPARRKLESMNALFNPKPTKSKLPEAGKVANEESKTGAGGNGLAHKDNRNSGPAFKAKEDASSDPNLDFGN